MQPASFGVVLALTSVLVVPCAASAQVEQEGARSHRELSSSFEVTAADGATFTVGFEDDLLTSLVNDGHVPRITVRPIKGRAFLLRPRMHFVPELLKSVERF
jgi:hypothetical protein